MAQKDKNTSDIKYRAWDIDSSEMIYTDDDNNYRDFFFDFSGGTLNLMMPVEDDYPELRNSVFMEYCKLADNKGEDIYDLDIIELTHTLKSRYHKGDKFVVFYD